MTRRHLPGWLPEWLRKWWHKSRCVCCYMECEWDWVNCGYCLNDSDDTDEPKEGK